MKFERSEIGALFSKLRTAVPEVRAVGNDSTGILLSGPDAFATNLELSIRAELSSPVPQDVVIPPRGVDFISGAVAPEVNINVTKSGLVLGRESHGGPEGQKCKGGHMKAHLAFLCNGRCQWCKNYWNCSKTKRLLAKILGCKDWRWQNR